MKSHDYPTMFLVFLLFVLPTVAAQPLSFGVNPIAAAWLGVIAGGLAAATGLALNARDRLGDGK